MPRLPLIGRLIAAVAGVAAVTFISVRLVEVNPTTVSLTYVVLILLIASWLGIVEAMTASLVAVLTFNFFFLPPVGTLTISNPENWVALVVFLVTAVVASQLSGRARARALEAISRQRDLERLYSVSRSLLLSEGGPSIPQAIAQRIADSFEIPGVALYDERTDRVAFGGKSEIRGVEARLRESARQSTSSSEGGVIITAVRLGGSPIGSLALAGVELTDTVLQSIANLAAIGLERARVQESTARAEVARRSGELRATLLDALAHEFKTPLTSMRIATDELSASPALSASREHELVDIVSEDLDRLQGLVTDAVRMIRIDGGDFEVRRQRQHVDAIARTAVAKLQHRLQGHQVVTHVPPDLEITADGGLLALALEQILDNAVKYSPPTSTIEIAATKGDRIDIAVRNSGPAIPEREQARIFERFYRGAQAAQIPGTGLGLAIVQQIVTAHGGRVSVSSPAGGITEFTLSLPADGAAS